MSSDSENLFTSEESDNNTSSSKSTTSSDGSDKIVTFIKLENDNKTEIQFVYHLSDIHIRNTQRHAEYKEVFTNTYKELKKQIANDKKKSLIVITGDIMHTKTELSPESFSLAQDFFKELSEIATTIIIPGNHDCNLSNRDRMDALTPIVNGNVEMSNLHYLKKTGIYQYYNIVFGVTSIFNEVFVDAKKISSGIWKNIKQKNKYKIALYHGAVHGAKTDVGYRMNNEQLLADDFDGYDFVMLGDIHRFQYMNKKETIAYAGSLIQQSYGESLDNHGILKWDLSDGCSELIKIKNNYGYCTIKITDGKISDQFIPKKPRIRFILENTNQLEYQEILAELEKKYQICEIVKDSNFKTNTTKQKKNKKKATAYATQESIIMDYLEKKGLDEKKITELIDLHKKIYQKILSEKKDQVSDIMHNASGMQKWKILVLKFSNTLSYGKDNVIDFTKYDPNKIIGIVAPNYYGKSAILDIILFCLFDKFSRGDRRDILNKKENRMSCSLLFSVGSQKYLIERIGQRSKNGLTVKIDVNFYSIRNENGKEKKEILNGLDKNETNKKITELIGNYNDYLTTCFCIQQGKTSNFIDMTQLQKKEYLNEILKLNVFEDCYNYSKEKLKKLIIQMKMIEEKFKGKTLDEIKKNVLSLNTEIKKLEKINLVLQGKMDIVDSFIESYQIDPITKYHELNNYDLTTEKSIKNILNKINSRLESHSNINIKKIRTDLKESKNNMIIIQKKINTINNEKYKKLVNEKEELLKRIVNVVDDEKKDYQTEIDDCREKIKIITTALEEHTDSDLSEKMSRIDEIKGKIMKLRQQLEPVSSSLFEDIKELNTKIAEMENIIYQGDWVSKLHQLNNDQKNKLSIHLKNKKSLKRKLKNNVNALSSYHYGSSSDNDQVVQQVMEQNKTWINEIEKWINQKTPLLVSNDYSIQDMFSACQQLKKKLHDKYLEQVIFLNNQEIKNKIKKLERESDILSEFKGTKMEIDNLKKEKKLLNQKINLLTEKMDQYNTNQEHKHSNSLIEIKIKKINDELNHYENQRLELEAEMNKSNTEIDELTQILDDSKELEKEQKHCVLLENYYYSFVFNELNTEYHQKWLKTKEDLSKEFNANQEIIDKHRIELKIYQKDLEQYLEIRKEFDDKSSVISLYQLYVQTMNYNGLPYEMLKTYLPMIQSDVNQILHSMVNFSIEFMFYDEKYLSDQKTKFLKSNMGCVDINLNNGFTNPYNVQLASGFEKFIINLAIRMTLCQISLTSKPNFLIIDEGWSCLDSDNLGNIGAIMNYIKMQYEHVIIISHIDELKNQSDYVININKNNGYSYINTSKHISKKIFKKID